MVKLLVLNEKLCYTVSGDYMTGFILKMIAMCTMLIDHTGAGLSNAAGFDPFMLRAVGRIAFPIYVFFIAEGCRHTKNIQKYALRLGVLALVSEWPFDMLFGNNAVTNPMQFWKYLEFGHQNVFFTLFLGVCAVAWLNRPQDKHPGVGDRLLNAFVVVAFIVCGEVFRTDYGALGVAAIVLCALCRDRAKQMVVLALMVCILYVGSLSAYNLSLLTGGLVSVALLMFYNGQEGPRAKWLFYSFYPVHLFVLWLIKVLYL